MSFELDVSRDVVCVDDVAGGDDVADGDDVAGGDDVADGDDVAGGDNVAGGDDVADGDDVAGGDDVTGSDSVVGSDDVVVEAFSFSEFSVFSTELLLDSRGTRYGIIPGIVASSNSSSIMCGASGQSTVLASHVSIHTVSKVFFKELHKTNAKSTELPAGNVIFRSALKLEKVSGESA